MVSLLGLLQLVIQLILHHITIIRSLPREFIMSAFSNLIICWARSIPLTCWHGYIVFHIFFSWTWHILNFNNLIEQKVTCELRINFDTWTPTNTVLLWRTLNYKISQNTYNYIFAKKSIKKNHPYLYINDKCRES